LSLPLGGYSQYVPLAPAERYRRACWLRGLFHEFAAQYPGLGDVLCRNDVIFDIVERVEKRRVYFRVFHGLVLSERNETALYCFWTLKLAPFVNLKDPGHPTSAVFAAFLFLQMLKRAGRGAGRPVSVSRSYAQNLAYAFTYHDLSKEAIMAMAASMLYGAVAREEN
jgi:hypothetical protein